jgi:hypothetical protein
MPRIRSSPSSSSSEIETTRRFNRRYRNRSPSRIRSRSSHRGSSQEFADDISIRSEGNQSRISRPEVPRSPRGSKDRRSESRRPERKSMTREELVLPEEPQRRNRSRSASLEELEPTEEVVPPQSKIFRLDRPVRVS